MLVDANNRLPANSGGNTITPIADENDVIAFANASSTPIVPNIDSIAALREAIAKAREGDSIFIESGSYGTLNITNKKGITLRAKDSNNPPVFDRINLENSHDMTLYELKIDGKNSASTGVRASNTNNLTLQHIEVTRTRDAINVISADNVNISHNDIHNVRRDGIVVVDIQGLNISNNRIHEFHPNYEAFVFPRDWGKNDNDFLPNGERRDHADFIQIVNSRGGINISHNVLNASGGAFTQSIFIHSEAGRPGYAPNYFDPVQITGNNIFNAHQKGIDVSGQKQVSENNNTLIYIPVRGIENNPEAHTPRISIQ